MSDNNNKDQTTARDYVKSYINNSNSAEFLEKEQPRFDPSKPVPSSQPEPVEEIKPKPVQDNSSHFNIHLPTQNPISNNENEKKQEPTAQQQQHWTTRGAKEQRSEIHETALTVCADLNEDLMNCFNNGSWWDKAKMCEDQKQKFWNCYNSQKKFLKEVNYKGPVNTEKDDDQILAAAYKLRDKLDDQAKTSN